MDLVSPRILPHIKDAEFGLASGDYATAERALAAALEFMPDHPTLRHMLAAVRGQTVDRPPVGYVGKLFDDFSETYDEAMRKKLEYCAPERIADLLIPRLKGKGRSDLRIVDLGCGTGFMGDALAPLGAEIVGIDISQKMLDRAAKLGSYAKLVQGDVVDELLRLREGQFDAIVAADVLVYLGDLRALFSAVKHALARGGIFAFSVEALEGDGTFQLRPSGRFAHTREYLRALARSVGLDERALLAFHPRFERDRHIEGWLACFESP